MALVLASVPAALGAWVFAANLMSNSSQVIIPREIQAVLQWLGGLRSRHRQATRRRLAGSLAPLSLEREWLFGVLPPSVTANVLGRLDATSRKALRVTCRRTRLCVSSFTQRLILDGRGLRRFTLLALMEGGALASLPSLRLLDLSRWRRPGSCFSRREWKAFVDALPLPQQQAAQQQHHQQFRVGGGGVGAQVVPPAQAAGGWVRLELEGPPLQLPGPGTLQAFRDAPCVQRLTVAVHTVTHWARHRFSCLSSLTCLRGLTLSLHDTEPLGHVLSPLQELPYLEVLSLPNSILRDGDLAALSRLRGLRTLVVRSVVLEGSAAAAASHPPAAAAGAGAAAQHQHHAGAGRPAARAALWSYEAAAGNVDRLVVSERLEVPPQLGLLAAFPGLAALGLQQSAADSDLAASVCLRELCVMFDTHAAAAERRGDGGAGDLHQVWEQGAAVKDLLRQAAALPTLQRLRLWRCRSPEHVLRLLRPVAEELQVGSVVSAAAAAAPRRAPGPRPAAARISGAGRPALGVGLGAVAVLPPRVGVAAARVACPVPRCVATQRLVLRRQAGLDAGVVAALLRELGGVGLQVLGVAGCGGVDVRRAVGVRQAAGAMGVSMAWSLE
eukprot:XP_001701737.1 predicted protein [Chlamydomonas reinhardtii]